jgi:uroporphyrinogen decarboxylase
MTHVKPGCEVFDDITEWKKYVTFPSCKDKNWEMAAMRTKAMWAKKDEIQGYVVGNMGGFEKICALMGHVNAMMAMYDDEEAFAEFIEAYADYRIEQFEYIKKYLDVDFVMMHDDWGNQQNMFFSPEMWRKFFKEPERRMVKRCQELGMHYMHHSCGYIEPIIPDLVEIGVESWHGGAPVNNLKKIKAEYGDKLIFAGGVDPQVTDTGKATEEEIRAEVRRVIDTLGKDGGLMISSAVMFSTVQNVDIIVDDETAKYGRYDTLKFD